MLQWWDNRIGREGYEKAQERKRNLLSEAPAQMKPAPKAQCVLYLFPVFILFSPSSSGRLCICFGLVAPLLPPPFSLCGPILIRESSTPQIQTEPNLPPSTSSLNTAMCIVCDSMLHPLSSPFSFLSYPET